MEYMKENELRSYSALSINCTNFWKEVFSMLSGRFYLYLIRNESNNRGYYNFQICLVSLFLNQMVIGISLRLPIA